MSEPVFFDPSGKRKRAAVLSFWSLMLITAASIVGFGVSIAQSPVLPSLIHGKSRHDTGILPHVISPSEALVDFQHNRAVGMLQSELKKLPPAPPLRKGDIVRAAFYAPWQETGLFSLRAHAKEINRLYPAWLHLGKSLGTLDYRDWDPAQTPHNRDVLKIAQSNGLAVMPMIDNAVGGKFQGPAVAAILSDPVKEQTLISELASFLDTHHFPGVMIDFESLDAETWKKMPAFLTSLRAAIPGKSISIALEATLEHVPAKEIAALVDRVALMTYDQNTQEDEAGPIAALDWTIQAIEAATESIPRSKIILGVGSYAYDWKKDTSQGSALTFQEAMTLARDNHEDEDPTKVIAIEPESLNRYFYYEDDNDQEHEVWLLDAVSAYNQQLAARNLGINQTALWVMGSEDPSYWNTFKGDPITNLSEVSYPYDVDYEGEGEILRVETERQSGSRKIDVDAKTGFITRAVDSAFATPITIRRTGSLQKSVALTFDDGPDEQYTPQILDYLKQEKIPATFFVIGENAEKYPQLVSRIMEEGHVLASHSYTHPNLGEVSLTRLKLELNATQRAIQSLTGRSTTLFRPPFNADAEPTSYEEVRPLVESAKLGYVTVGETIDPTDWMPGISAQKIADVMVKGVTENKGNCVLLHDAGGDRSQTIKALKIAIPKLKALGFSFVTAANLMHMSRDQVMPKITDREVALVGFDLWLFRIAYAFQTFLAIGFASGIILGILRLFIVTPLAWFKKKQKPLPQIHSKVSVTALIAAYNEEKVITRTISSILKSDYPIQEVIVIDDGSTDATAKAVADEFQKDDRVRLIVKPNGGKASALNIGLAEASGEVLFCVDADTIVAKDAVRKLVAHFENDQVAAVAGNVKVGNISGILTEWQSLEYTTCQNMDRSAYEVLNSITVVPGAIGAWRKSAVTAAGGYQSDTLAEDMDLTWRLHRQGGIIRSESAAKAYTEAPGTLSDLMKQRYRWSFGTFQCLWKHRDMTFKKGGFGWFALPMLWIFQVFFQIISPLIDIQLLLSFGILLATASSNATAQHEWQPYQTALETFLKMLSGFGLFLLLESLMGWVAYRWEGETPRPLRWLFLQRFCYRQMLYYVMLKSLKQAIFGQKSGWGKLKRSGTVTQPST